MSRDTVLLVHGHGGHPLQFRLLQRALERDGFRTIAWRYHSTRGSIEGHAAKLAEDAHELDRDADVARLHFVGHSMGAIVVRRALAIARPAKLGRVVLLAPPNRGARLADWALRLFGRRIIAATELCSDPDSYVNRLAGASDIDCGIIAASWDQVVPLAATRLPSQRDHVVVRSFHGTLPLHPRTHAQVGHFLRQGRFLSPTDRGSHAPKTAA